MKAYTFKNGNVVIRRMENGVQVFDALISNSEGELVKTITVGTYGEAKNLASA